MDDIWPYANLDNVDLFDLFNGSTEHCFPLLVLDELTFDPFTYYDNDTLFNECNTPKPICKYYFSEDLIQPTRSSCNIFACNISSLPQHLFIYIFIF